MTTPISSMSQFPLPLSDQPRRDATPWAISPPEPTNLITLWRRQDQPTRDQVMQCLSRAHVGPIESLQEISPRDEQMAWACAIQPVDWPNPVIMWVEPMRELPPDEIKTLNAESIRWAIGAEMMLDPDDPLGDFVALLRLLGRAFSDSPAILDVNKEEWHTRLDLDSNLLPEQFELTESLLWITHAVGAQSSTPESTVWIYTTGLTRCGLPELEMLEVPHTHFESAVSLLNSIAELIVEGGMPPPGQRMEVGADLAVTFQPWKEVAPFISPGSPGGMDRMLHNGEPADGVRAVVCATEPAGTYRKLWTWPREVVRHVASTGLTAIFKTARATRRQAQLAGATWDELAAAFAALPASIHREGDNRPIVFLIKAGFQPTPPKSRAKNNPLGDIDLLIAGAGREHLWFEVKDFKGGRAEGLLMNEPYHVRMRKGDRARIDRGMVSDWQVLTRRGNFGPSDIVRLREAIQQFAKGVV